MKILVDENISYAYELFSRLGNVKTISGYNIPVDELNIADALIIRSITKVDKTLLDGKNISFVGTATAGIDHIDHVWLKRKKIGFSAAPGCNAIAVVEYVLSALLMLAERDGFKLNERTVGIVGIGNIGRRLQRLLKILGVRTLLCDPPVANSSRNIKNFYTLNELLNQADVITFHTPLLKDGPYKTFHLLNEKLIRQLKSGTILINTCRGSVIDNTALLACLKDKQKLSVVLDVWEQEPNINTELLNYIDIGTAHIAGYTLEGKARGIAHLFKTYSAFIGKPQHIALSALLPKSKFDYIFLNDQLSQSILNYLVNLIYDIRIDDAALRKASANIPNKFNFLRKNHFGRREWSSLKIICKDVKTSIFLQKLGFSAIYHLKH